MANYRERLPQMGGVIFLTDGGIETTSIFHEGFDLPSFAAFDLPKHDAGRAAVHKYFRTNAAIALNHCVGFILESATWRASADWVEKLGYSACSLAAVNRQAIALLHEIRRQCCAIGLAWCRWRYDRSSGSRNRLAAGASRLEFLAQVGGQGMCSAWRA